MAASLLQAPMMWRLCRLVELAANYRTGSDPIEGETLKLAVTRTIYRGVIASLIEAGIFHLMPQIFPGAELYIDAPRDARAQVQEDRRARPALSRRL